MITLNIENLFNVNDSQIHREEFSKTVERLPEYMEKIKKRGQGFYFIVHDDPSTVMAFAESVEGKFDDIVVLGIGGSALGTICLRDALTDPHGKSSPRLHVMENIDPYVIEKLNDSVNFERTLFITISKSGDTPETVAQYLYFRKKTDELGLDAKKHHVFITGSRGFLRETGRKDGLEIFDVPENVGGRFAVLTNVGLLPTALIGADVKEMLKGGQDMVKVFMSENFEENSCFQLAAAQYLGNQNGININVLMPYSSRLESFEDWYAQLLAESIGKNGKGITPVGALGATDQHSQLQLYNEGPRDKMIMFLEVKDHASDIKIPETSSDYEKVNYLKGVSFEKLLATEFTATRDAVTEYGKPNLTISVGKVDAYNLGALFMLFEGATAFLGEFFNIDAFNQPGVELGKKLTKKYLEKK